MKLESPQLENSYRSERIHVDKIHERLAQVDDADAYIRSRQEAARRRINDLLAQIGEVMAKLGIVPSKLGREGTSDGGGTALVAVSTRPDTEAYKGSLVLAAEETIPALNEQLALANNDLARWLGAPMLPLKASIGPSEDSIASINERIHTIELYAGLTEEAVRCRKGKPAALTERLRVMQRRLYMDEECLLGYEAGGMEFKDVGEFDRWISRPVNRDRILPFPRTLVAMRVRREEKEREDYGDMMRAFINMKLKDADKTTFLYVRNGDQVWRVDCSFDFDEMIFPDRDRFDPSQTMMMKDRGRDRDDIITTSLWEAMRDEEEAALREARAWKRKHRGKDIYTENYELYKRAHPFHSYSEYAPFDPSNIYFDDASRVLADEMKRYNRIAVIIQGLFDRSEVLHPHPPVRVWDPASFAASIELVYDAATLTHGEKPDFEAYRASLNATITADSLLVGQDDFWQRREAARENNRLANDYRRRGSYPRYTRLAPDGDPGPGLIARPARWRKGRQVATFHWNRESYIRWAPLLLTAEDYHAGKLKISPDGRRWSR